MPVEFLSDEPPKPGGLTWFNAVNDQVAGIGAVIVPGTVRDSLYVLDTMLNLDGGPKPAMIASDTACYSDVVFGIFTLLGYRFSPRIADLADQRLWRATSPGRAPGDYGTLNDVARHKINLEKITTHWEDTTRVAASLATGTVRAYDVLRMLTRESGAPNPLGAGITEYGRIAKTLHLLALIDPTDESYWRSINTQLTVQESRHRLARAIFHGRRGQIYQRYREGQEDQLGALGLVVNAVVLWNTRYIDAAVIQLREAGQEISETDIARLSPLGDAHINMLGRYAFTTPTPTPYGPCGRKQHIPSKTDRMPPPFRKRSITERHPRRQRIGAGTGPGVQQPVQQRIDSTLIDEHVY